jgi:Rrf2 family protein
MHRLLGVFAIQLRSSTRCALRLSRSSKSLNVQLDCSFPITPVHLTFSEKETNAIVERFSSMMLLRRGLLAIAAVVEVALQKDGPLLSAKKLSARHGLPPRHLEQILQALVHDGILEGVRGPSGGYRLACDLHGVTARDILRAAEIEPAMGAELKSPVVTEVVLPLLSAVEQECGGILGRIRLDDVVKRANGGNAEPKHHAAPAVPELPPSKSVS